MDLISSFFPTSEPVLVESMMKCSVNFISNKLKWKHFLCVSISIALFSFIIAIKWLAGFRVEAVLAGLIMHDDKRNVRIDSCWEW